MVGLALYGLPLYYDFMVREFGWSRTMVTSGNAISKLVVGPLFGFGAGWIVDRFGPRRLMMAGILMAGGALVGLGLTSAAWTFYFFYFFNALGYVCGGPLPCQVLVSRWFDRTRGKAMGIAYLGIGIGGAVVPLLAHWLTDLFGWRGSLQAVGVLIILIAFPLAYLVREAPPDAAAPKLDGSSDERRRESPALRTILATPAFYLLALGSMCSIAAVGGTNQNLKLFLSLDRGYSQGDAAQVISLVLAVSIAGRLLMGWLADRMPRKYVMLIIYLLVAGAIPLLLIRTSWSIYVFRRHLWPRARRRIPDHSADGGRTVRRWSARSRDGHRADRRRSRRGDRPDAGGQPSRPLRHLRRRLSSARRRGAGRRRRHRASSEPSRCREPEHDPDRYVTETETEEDLIGGY